MNPSEDPRYRPNDTTEAPVTEDPDRIHAELATHQELLATFATKGWEHIEAALTQRRQVALARLVSVAGSTSMDEVNVQRGALSVIDYLLGQPEYHRNAADIARQRLTEMEGTG